MSIKDNKPSKKEEEIDLGQLFNLIGKMFTNFFNFIGSIFKGAYNFLILILIHLFKYAKWHNAALIIGVVAGFVLDRSAVDIYSANMYIETNFNSSRQAYETILNLNQLSGSNGNKDRLASMLGITVVEAESIKGFYIEPEMIENTTAKGFFDYKMQLDSVSRSEVNYEDYKKGLSDFSYKLHKIGVSSTDQLVFSKLSGKLIEEMERNSYLSKLQEVTNENLINEEKSILKEQMETDSLANEYLTLRKNESEKKAIPGTGTNFFLGAAEETNVLINEQELFQRKFILDGRMRTIAEEKVEIENIINVISDFPLSGYIVFDWTTKKKFTWPIFLFGVSFLITLILPLVKYLKLQDALLNEKKVS